MLINIDYKIMNRYKSLDKKCNIESKIGRNSELKI